MGVLSEKLFSVRARCDASPVRPAARAPSRNTHTHARCGGLHDLRVTDNQPATHARARGAARHPDCGAVLPARNPRTCARCGGPTADRWSSHPVPATHARAQVPRAALSGYPGILTAFREWCCVASTAALLALGLTVAELIFMFQFSCYAATSSSPSIPCSVFNTPISSASSMSSMSLSINVMICRA